MGYKDPPTGGGVAGSSGSSASNGGWVFTGVKYGKAKVTKHSGDTFYAGKYKTVPSYSYNYDSPDNLTDTFSKRILGDQKFRNQQIRFFRSLGYRVNSITQLQNIYGRAVKYAEKNASSKLTVDDAVQFLSPSAFGGGGSGGGGGGGGNGTSVQTQKSFNISSAKDAKAFINQSFQQELGREATSDEIKQFRKALNSEEKKNPTITKTTNVVSGSNVSTTSKTSGGMDRGAYSLEQAPKAKDYAEFQAETTFMDAMMQAIKGG